MTVELGVIFDMDGVLVDSSQAHFDSWQALGHETGGHETGGQETGIALTREQFVATFGRTSREILRQFWPHVATSDAAVAELDSRKEAIFRELLARDFPAMDGAVELIDALAAERFALAIGSSGPPENVALVLDKLGRREAFRGIVTGMDVSRGKPDPQVFLLAAERIGLPPDRCVVIEDAPAGVAAAKAAGAKCIGLASLGRDPQTLAQADWVVRSLREISPAHISRLIAC
jgi:beta-phosphoglucomutase